MKLELKPFQTVAVSELRRKADTAATLASDGDDVAVILSAPTGAGKTVMAAAFMEALLTGDQDFPADPDATFLWLTDQPELNVQTLDKFASASSEFDDSKLLTIEAGSFDQETLDPGCVYFLNTQKLAVTSKLVHHADERTYTLWETVANTIAKRPGSFWLVLDEAHRGMGRAHRNGSIEEAQTIVQKFITGDQDVGLPTVPLILGISATPDRFTKLLEQTDRTKMNTTVAVEDVRSSGLLKETIALYHTDEQQPSDESLLASAAAKLKEYEQAWKAYSDAQNSAIVRPVLVVQVEDKRAKSKALTKTNLGAAIKVLEDALETLTPPELGHAFQEGGTVLVDDSYPLRHIAPSDIEADPDVRIVFFKRALSTGWDCPRAEVMMSFRAAKDETLIAQLVGRMVRTPLARPATGSALLNSVALYLPQYDRHAVDSVIKRLSEPHPDDGLPGTDTIRGNDTVTLKPDPQHAAVLQVASQLPAYTVDRVAKLRPVRRLMKLGDRLLMDDLDDTAKGKYERELLDFLDSERDRLVAPGGIWAARIKEAGLIDVRRRDVTVLDDVPDTGEPGTAQKVKAVSINIEHAFAEAGRLLGEGLHRAYLKARARQLTDAGEEVDVSVLKREIWVLASDSEVLQALEARANTLCDAELDNHETAINHLPDEKRAEYRAILREGAKAKAERWDAPDAVEGDKEGDPYDRHLYVKPDGTYTNARLTSLEKTTIADELARKDVLAWFRNVERKSWAYSVYYDSPSGPRNMYPDFLVFRQDGQHIVCDLLEPHTLSQSDSVAKAKGFARIVDEDGQKFGRVQMLDEVDGKLKRLELKNSATRQQVKALDNPDALRQLFRDA